MDEVGAERYKPLLLKRVSIHDAQQLYALRYAAYLPLYGAYGSQNSPCAQSHSDFTKALARGRVFSLYQAEQLVGGVRVSTQECAMCIEEIYIHPARQHKGLGLAALRNVQLRFPAPRFITHVVQGDPTSAALFLREGFEYTGEKHQVSDRLTLLRLEKRFAEKLTLRIAPLHREDAMLAMQWCASDGKDAELYRLLWDNGKVIASDAQALDQLYAFGKHYAGAPQLDFVIRANQLSQPIGLVSLARLDWELHRAELDFLLLDPIWRGYSLGRRAVAMVCDYAAAQYDFRTVAVTVLEENQAAVHCFERAGFTQTLRRANVMRGGFGQPHSRLLMVRPSKEISAYDD